MPDSHEFIAALDDSIAALPSGWNDLLGSSGDLIVTRAPSGLDVIGGIADDSGSLVVEWPIQNAAHVAIQRRTSRWLRIASLAKDPNARARVFAIDLRELLGMDYANLGAR